MGGVNICKKWKHYDSTTECYPHINPLIWKSHGNNDAYVTGAGALEFQM